MQCQTVKVGTECTFMTKKGCEFIGGACRPINEECKGCDRVINLESGVFCMVFPDPSVKWRRGVCNMATHRKVETKAADAKVRVGQQKQKKR